MGGESCPKTQKQPDVMKKIVPVAIGIVGILEIVLVIVGGLSTSFLFLYGAIIWILGFHFHRKAGMILSVRKILLPVTLFFSWFLFETVRSVFVLYGQDINYWRWKFAALNAMQFCGMGLIYVGIQPDLLKETYRFWFKYVICFFPLYFLLPVQGTNAIVMPMLFAFIFWRKIPFLWKIILLGMCAFLIASDLTARGTIVKIMFALLCGILCGWKRLNSRHIFRLAWLVLILLAPVCFLLAYLDIFNPFQIGLYFNMDITVMNPQAQTESLLSDSRTFLYWDILNSLEQNSQLWQGRGFGYGYHPTRAMFLEAGDITGIYERFGAEVGILDVLLFQGIIGGILYSGVLLAGSWLAVSASRNRYSKFLGLAMAFSLCWSWVWEKPTISAFYFFNMLILGSCYSPIFRNFTDREFETYIESIWSHEHA